MIFDIDFFTNTTKVGFVPYSYYYYCYNSTSLSHTFKTNEYERIKKHYFEVLIKLSKAGFSSRELNVAHKYMIIKTRAYIYNLYGTDLDCNVKNKLISDVVEDDLLWDQIKKTNVIRILPLKLKLFYIALLLKQEWILKMITLYANRYSRK